MAIISVSGSDSPESIQTPLLHGVVQGSVDYKGLPIYRSNSGGWRSASFILGMEFAERLAHYGIASNLITYLTGPLGQSTATAAENVNAWTRASFLFPLIGAFVADSFLGRYRTIVVSSLICILGLGLLTMSATISSFGASNCPSTNTSTACSPSPFQVVFFFFSLYLVAFGQGAYKSCVQAFGADQFDEKDPGEHIAKSSFFNWWYFCLCSGILLARLFLVYIQDNLNWTFGFGIPCIVMVIALFIFLLGSKTYRYIVKVEEKSAFQRIGQVFVATVRNWRSSCSAIALEEESCGSLPHRSSEQFKFLDKALFVPNDSKEREKVCSLSEVEEAKAILRLVPIWALCLLFGVVDVQFPTLCTKQGATMDRSIAPGFDIPPASFQSIATLSVVTFIPIYDRIIVPLARDLTREPSGITMLQRIGTGMFFSALSMAIAAIVEMKRLAVAREYGLVDKPNETLPMSIWWLVPQYITDGVAHALTAVGMQEFFYDQVPRELRSVGLSLFISAIGVGSLISSFLISIIEIVTGGKGRDSWFANNLNRAHLDYFYWLLAGLGTLQLVAYLYFAKKFVNKR
ncbi:hypothetical protein P3X46_021590 [Hevea brasiliensis]|uniref:Protein NRT1/ PTR FAMILY 5.10-like n=1 Tax=Hevea brasiliensis TaxID=3981 RepID=A0ABQ9LG39_HEVBR|nr:protein NRT1/ PTR FAMILY 5.10-like [Hevea brasiliensis]KAJ9166901.1 hypothetical protein P3X46_021590 [Hevea brasiliensis]